MEEGQWVVTAGNEAFYGAGLESLSLQMGQSWCNFQQNLYPKMIQVIFFSTIIVAAPFKQLSLPRGVSDMSLVTKTEIHWQEVQYLLNSSNHPILFRVPNLPVGLDLIVQCDLSVSRHCVLCHMLFVVAHGPFS